MQENQGNTGNTGTTGQRNLGNIPHEQVKLAVMRGYDQAHQGGSFNALPSERQSSIVDQTIDAFTKTKGNLADTPKGVPQEIATIQPYVLSELKQLPSWNDQYERSGFQPTGETRESAR